MAAAALTLAEISHPRLAHELVQSLMDEGQASLDALVGLSRRNRNTVRQTLCELRHAGLCERTSVVGADGYMTRLYALSRAGIDVALDG